MTRDFRLIPKPDWTPVGPRGHGVQFYQADDTLVLLLSNFVGTALVPGGASIDIATPVHHARVSACLRLRGRDVGVAREQGRYLAYGAADTLARFFRNGKINSDAFHATIGPIIERATAAVGQERPR